MTDKAYIWDKRHIKGNYAYCSDTHTHIPIVNSIIKFKCEKILDVGCYTGTLPAMLPYNMVSSYHGIDISQSALSVARDKCNGLADVSFEIADLEGYNSTRQFDCIIFAGIFTYPTYNDKIAIEYAKKFNPDYIIVQDVVRKREMYPNLKKNYEQVHKEHYQIKARTQRNLRQLYVFKI